MRLDDVEEVRDSSVWRSQVVLPMIEELLRESGKKISDISTIEVNTGPGSYTGLRVGAAIANALGYALKIPVNGKRISERSIVEPDLPLEPLLTGNK